MQENPTQHTETLNQSLELATEGAPTSPESGDVSDISNLDEELSLKKQYIDLFQKVLNPVNEILALAVAEQERQRLLKEEQEKYMTEADKKLMSEWEKEYPEWTKTTRDKISFGEDEKGAYIGFEIMPGKILKMDREDLFNEAVDWNTAMLEAEKQGKRLPTGDENSKNPEANEWGAMIQLMPGEGRERYKFLQKLINMLIHYWSSSTYAPGSGIAWLVYFSVGFQTSFGKASNYYVRCVR